MERDGDIVAGVIYDPTRDEMYWAEKGAGAFLNDRRLRVSARRQLGEALIATGFPFRGRPKHPAYNATLARVMEATSGVRRFGSAALDLAYVAAGRYDGYWEFALSPWDLAAGLLLVREAGGFVSDLAGGQGMMTSGDVLAANGHLHLPLAALIKEAMRTEAMRTRRLSAIQARFRRAVFGVAGASYQVGFEVPGNLRGSTLACSGRLHRQE